MTAVREAIEQAGAIRSWLARHLGANPLFAALEESD